MKNGMCGKKCCGVSACMCGNKNLGLLLLRLAAGSIFLVAGIMKLQGMDMVVGYFGSMGIPAFVAWLVAIIEVLGGAMLILGVFVRKAAILLSVIIAAAIILVHAEQGYMGMQAPLTIFAVTMALTMLGGGKYSMTGMCRCGGKCMACKDEKNDCSSCGSGCAGGTCGTDAKTCDGCEDKCAGGTCSMHETK